jgi:hypothetical protein
VFSVPNSPALRLFLPIGLWHPDSDWITVLAPHLRNP